ncbi:hypothetical protein K1T71_005661 [Dendrolimus kikuchii]|uniref:Uncharacterized protein n=1 Tax=Dendrolimus kikuchii TaxID=765133 RepID=A0ACC1D4V4_9NEOP|nr:hypothetical protein K1T71_005661 [Dendrolimus kikuchii]
MLGRALISRAFMHRNLLTAVNNIKHLKRNAGHGTWTYRMPPPMPSKKAVMIAEVLGGLCWWWIIYHCLTEPGHIFGEWPYIDPSTWTDEELGVPPDSAGPLKH